MAYFLLPESERKFRINNILITALVFVSFYENLAFYFGKGLGLKNHWVYNIFFFHFSTWINLFLLREFTLRLIFKKIIFGCVWILLICSAIPYTLGFFPFNEFNSYSALLASSLVIFACALFFYDLLSNDLYLNIDIHRYSGFWITTLILFFYSSNFIFLISLAYVIKNNSDLFMLIVKLPSISSILVYLSFLLTLAKFRFFKNYIFNNIDKTN